MARPGPGGFNNPVGVAPPRWLPAWCLRREHSAPEEAGAKVEALTQAWFPAVQPCPLPKGPLALPGAPSSRVPLKVRPGVCSTSKCRTAMEFKALGGNVQLCSSGGRAQGGRWALPFLSWRDRWTISQGEQMSQARAQPGQPDGALFRALPWGWGRSGNPSPSPA